MKKSFLILFILFSLSISQNVYAEVLSGSGIIPGQIWYSKDTLVEGETVYIHTAIWNDKDYNLLLKVGFYDDKILLGERDISIKPNELKDVSVAWKITPGDHTISAKITSSIKEGTSALKESVSLPRVSTVISKNSVTTTVKNSEGDTLDITNTVKEKVGEVVPDNVSDFVSTNFSALENFRNNSSDKISNLKDDTKKELESVKNFSKNKDNDTKSKTSFEESTKEPLTYVKLFLVSVLAFILKSSLVFYGLSIVIIFYLIRFIYRKIRNR